MLGIALRLAALSLTLYLAVDAGYRLLEDLLWVPEVPAVEEQVKAGVKGRLSPGEFGVIMERNLFGSVSPASRVKEQGPRQESSAPELPAAGIKARLLGTVSGPDGVSRAVIEDQERKRQGLYKIGDSVQGAVLKEIQRGKVILRVGNRDEALTITDASRAKAVQRPGLSDRKGAPPAGSEVVVKKEDVEASFANLNELLNQMRIKPYFADGKPAGLAVAWVKPESFFTAMGLKSGDVIQAINESPIKSADDIIAVYKDLKIGSDISLQVLRDNKLHTINYRFE